MTRLTRAITLSVVAATLALPCAATYGVGVDAVTRDRTNQERARQLTADLLSALLDAHVQQLEDNGLTDLPLYQDLLQMRGRLGDLAMQVMPEVIDLLNAADAARAEPDKHKDFYRQARSRMRQVLVRLLAERERPRLRRQQAELRMDACGIQSIAQRSDEGRPLHRRVDREQVTAGW